ncbi:Fructosamine kinase-domain-containing protein [Xylogone sp. PMI_703]|nr:Fructosamine kinase-domain-containing protein [Xylogone sp. PMI_703]
MPEGTKVVSAEYFGVSAWAKTAKVSVILPDGAKKNYFLKCATGESALPLVEGEYHSATAINSVVPGFVPNAVGYGEYDNGEAQVHFFLGDFHDMDLSTPPDPVDFAARLAELHSKGTSPNGMFGFPVTTVCGRMARTVTWEKSWAKCFSNLLLDVIKYDNEANDPWPEYDAACKQLIDAVIPRLLGALQSDGREITPALIHGDLWERNIGIDMETGETIVFDPGCTYAHNEMEFGTWRCSWAYYFNSPMYMELYETHVERSHPVEEWDDRNRLYSIHPYLNDSAGHPGSLSRKIAYNDMLYLCEKYAPLDTLEKYSPEHDISVTGAYTDFVIKQLE